MKKKIFTLALGVLSTTASFAQLANGSVAPDFTLKDINGNTHHLYDYLNAGKTVIIDLSAAWCGPCWSYHHTTRALEDIWKAHGPTGGNGVNANTTNDVMVLMVEGESSNTRAQLYGTSSGSSHATYSQGDWVTGTLYPIIDTDAAATIAFNQAWGFPGYPNQYSFPTVYMICRDRLVYDIGQPSAANLYSLIQQGCPTVAPSSTTDAKALLYMGSEFFYCNAAPAVKFQNYSQTNTITSATIKVYNGSNVLATVPWTGSLAPYQVATVNVPSFAGTALGGYKYDVTVTGDSYPANNGTPDSAFKIYVPANATSLPYTESFEGLNAATGLPYRYSTSGTAQLPYNTSGAIYQLSSGYDGTRQVPFLIDLNNGYGSGGQLILGNFNTAAATNVALNFYIAHAAVGSAAGSEKIEVQVSNDCGATWQNAWSKSGAALQTANPIGNTRFYPSGPAQWRQETANLTAYKGSNMLVRIKGTQSTAGNYCWLDALKMTPTLGLSQASNVNTVKIYPNPSNGTSTISFMLTEATKVQVSVVDATGRIVANPASEEMTAGTHEISLNTVNLAAGVYNVMLKTEQGALTQRLSVVK